MQLQLTSFDNSVEKEEISDNNLRFTYGSETAGNYFANKHLIFWLEVLFCFLHFTTDYLISENLILSLGKDELCST